MTGLSANDALTLVQIRAMLDLARRVAGSSAPVSRQTALVLLHAVNERVTHFAAHSLPQVQAGQKEQFGSLHNKVREALGERWDANDGWVDVQLLQRARNAAQHEGLGADPALLPGWVAATELYTRTLVVALFSVALDEVYLAEAINDPVQASHLRKAEKALDIEDVPESLGATRAAFESASQRWVQSFREAHGRLDVGVRHSHSGFTEFTSITRAIEGVESAVAAMAFAVDPAEFTWFQSLRRVSSHGVSVEQARRALSFVFWWIVRWQELQTASQVESARRQAETADARAARTRDRRDTPARVASAAVLVGQRGSAIGRVRVALELRDLPEPGEFARWTASIEEINRSLSGIGQLRLTARGTHLIADIDPEDDTDALIRRANELLRDAEGRAARKRADHEAQQRADELDDTTFADDLAAAQLPTWISSARLCRTTDVRSWLGNSRLRIRFRIPAALHDEVAAILADQDNIETVRSDGDEYVIYPELSANQLSEATHAVTAAVQQVIANALNAEATTAKALADLNSRLAQSLARFDG